MTPERKFFNDILIPKFKDRIPEGDLIYDIGKSLEHDYKASFPKHNYKSIDINRDANPDIVMDVECTPKYSDTRAQGIIVMGVTEQCRDPFALIEGADRLLLNFGCALFGIMSVAYPIVNEVDYARFTPNGAKRLLSKYFDIEEWHVIDRNMAPSYCFAICRKNNYD